MPSESVLREPTLYWAISVLTLLAGASFVYVAIKAPFFWGVIFIPGVVLLNVWLIATIIGAVFALQRRKSAA
ncbi:MAG: hypothetical protein JRN71_07115 [Nitrososphaerota archaeon]|jgi:hypothetical protein|nr:hypothetical protein [Nitrososphaerota archaeon]MDG6987517.1 hypothetical protein [Nitrososphaerota archaeon]